MQNRTILAVAVVIILSHMVGLGIYISYNASDLSSAREQHVADQLVTLTRLLEREPAGRRAEMAGRISDQSLQLSVDEMPRVTQDDAQEGDTRALRRLLGFAIGTAFNKNVLADYREIAGEDLDEVVLKDTPDRAILAQRATSMFRFSDDLLVSIQFPDGQWLNALVPGSAFSPFLNPGLFPSTILMAVVTLILVAWAVNRPLGVLSNFTRAAEALGTNPTRADALPEEGPAEIRRAVRAFNLMQRRVQGLVEDRTRMIAAMSDDLSAPLTRMRLRAEYVENARERQKMFEDIADMEAMLSSTERFVDDEISGASRFRIDLAAMMRELAHEFGVALPELHLHGVPELSYTCAPAALRRASANLMSNAVIYGGTARIRIDLQPDEVIIDIDDEGPGIPEAERENVFKPFHRLEPARARHTAGAGLGLSIARSIVRAHGGEVTLAAAPGGGNRVRVTLPLTDAAPGGGPAGH